MQELYANPVNGHTEAISRWAWLWALLFGPFFFAARGVWPHFVLAWLVWPWGTYGALLAPVWLLGLFVGPAGLGGPGLGASLALILLAVPAIAYAARTGRILRTHYGRLGWRRVQPRRAHQPDVPPPLAPRG